MSLRTAPMKNQGGYLFLQPRSALSLPGSSKTEPGPKTGNTPISQGSIDRMCLRTRFLFAVLTCGFVFGSAEAQSADQQTQKGNEGGQPAAVGGVKTGGPHPAVLDDLHRPIT